MAGTIILFFQGAGKNIKKKKNVYTVRKSLEYIKSRKTSQMTLYPARMSLSLSLSLYGLYGLGLPLRIAICWAFLSSLHCLSTRSVL